MNGMLDENASVKMGANIALCEEVETEAKDVSTSRQLWWSDAAKHIFKSSWRVWN
jgi:hypothetical protein